jgi:hypothetical protein
MTRYGAPLSKVTECERRLDSCFAAYAEPQILSASVHMHSNKHYDIDSLQSLQDIERTERMQWD